MGQRESRGRARRFLRVLPAVLIVGGVLFDVLTPPTFTAAPFFAAAPVMAAPFFSFRGTLVTGVIAVAGIAGLRATNGTETTGTSITEQVTVVTVAAIALLINRVIQRSGEQLASARVVAETAQRAVLPVPSERIGGLHIAARYEAAQAGTFIGGDLFAVQDTPYGVRLVVGDVRGKGLGAVEAVAVVIGAFREAAEQEATIEGVAQRLERALTREGVRREGLDAFEGFTTAALAEIPRGRQDLIRLLNRGHPEPLLLYVDGSLDVLAPGDPALPLGLSDLAAWPDRADESPFPPGATLLMYTDGLSEARNTEGVFYNPQERLRGRVFPGPEELLTALSDDVRLHTGGHSTDDMALLAVERPMEGQPDRRRMMGIVRAAGHNP
ncbi:PP2C family protein-serine/threonine phosphatase [Streptomyces sp. A 4/2]|uniref:PP2C family protein-serine/threonine phosphatase n=1 Tax=Streptomyces sp. A 4/2 TaxID=2934314 RepID=UPI0027E54050|nr:PP2C family protein-serine/threonine phosphatase [Streptomyces sp. A 4/2]